MKNVTITRVNDATVTVTVNRKAVVTTSFSGDRYMVTVENSFCSADRATFSGEDAYDYALKFAVKRAQVDKFDPTVFPTF